MGTLNHPSDLSHLPATAASPSWVMLNCYTAEKDSDSDDGDAKTAAICRTTTGWLIRVSLLLRPPPATSTFRCSWVGEVPGDEDAYYVEDDTDLYVRPPPPHIRAIAAHDNAVLFEMWIPEGSLGSRRGATACKEYFDYFLYDAGCATVGTPPSLLLLPGARFLCRQITYDTGVLRRGGGGAAFVLAQLEVARHAPRDTAELAVLRAPGGGEWEIKRLPIVTRHNLGARTIDERLRYWYADATVPVGDRFLCWVDHYAGVLVWDVAADEAYDKLLLLPLPREPDAENMKRSRRGDAANRPDMMLSRTLAVAGSGALRFVSVDQGCCCSRGSRSTRARSCHAFTVTTWTVNLLAAAEGEPMAWVEDAAIDCHELWVLPNYYGVRLPRVRLQIPVVSADDPDVVYFWLVDKKGSWTLEVNTRSKALLSVLPNGTRYRGWDELRYRLPAKLRIQ